MINKGGLPIHETLLVDALFRFIELDMIYISAESFQIETVHSLSLSYT